MTCSGAFLLISDIPGAAATDQLASVGECPGGDPVSEFAPYSIPKNKELQMIFHFHQYGLLFSQNFLAFADNTPSQGFDRGAGGFGRSGNPNWKLADFKKPFNHWAVEMEKEGGWNSN